MEQHDEKVTWCETTAVFNDLAQVVSDEAKDVVQLVFFVGRAHNLLEVLSMLD